MCVLYLVVYVNYFHVLVLFAYNVNISFLYFPDSGVCLSGTPLSITLCMQPWREAVQLHVLPSGHTTSRVTNVALVTTISSYATCKEFLPRFSHASITRENHRDLQARCYYSHPFLRSTYFHCWSRNSSLTSRRASVERPSFVPRFTEPLSSRVWLRRNSSI
jgi:hypothetical protein